MSDEIKAETLGFVKYLFKYDRIDQSSGGTLILDGFVYGSPEFEEAIKKAYADFKNNQP